MFDNYYKNRKDWRKPYRKAARFDRSCRNHGDCPWCARNRMFPDLKRLMAAEEQIKEFNGGVAESG